MTETTAADSIDALGPTLPIGTYEEALTWVGRESSVLFSPMPVNECRIRLYLALLRDGNRTYWDPRAMESVWAGRPAPPGMLLVWLMPLCWQPDGVEQVLPLATRVPLPGRTLINVETDTEFHRPVFVGDRLNRVETVTGVSERKRTRLGVGHFVNTVANYRDQAGVEVATEAMQLFRFEPGEG
jgi:acyl dehydratase